jgi:hypothetical protein
MQALFGLMGLVLRRQVALWMDWRPWLALLDSLCQWACFSVDSLWQFGATVRPEMRYGLPTTLGKMVCGCMLVFSWA